MPEPRLTIAKAGRARALWAMLTTAFEADPWRATAAFGLSMTGAASNALSLLWLKILIDAAIKGDVHRVTVMASVVALSAAVGLASAITKIDLRFRMEERTGLLIDQRIIALTTGIWGLEHHERPEYLDQLELLRSQKGELGGSIGALIENFGSVSSMATTAILLATLHPALLLLLGAGIPSLAASVYAEKAVNRVTERTAEQRRRATTCFVLATTSEPGKELRVFGLGDEVIQRHDRDWNAVDREITSATLGTAVTTTMAWLVFALGYVAAITFIAVRAVHHQATVADVVLAVTLAGRVNSEVGGLYRMLGWLTQTLKVVGRYLWLVDYAHGAADHVARRELLSVPHRIFEGIRLENVSFRYPGAESDVLRGVDLTIPAGSTVAIVGDNGAGKSTLVKLLARFYEPTTGVITVDGFDLRDMDVGEWRTRTAAGFQDFARLELIARETVGVGYLPALDDETAVLGALGRASGLDVPPTLPAGLETQLGKSFEGGVELSGGQWQKLALGRAMMRESPLLLLLDEPTAALDAETEHALFERYAGAARAASKATGAITVLVSHRFSTVRMADLILVVDGGRIAEAGSHADLMASAALYAELYELQARAYS